MFYPNYPHQINPFQPAPDQAFDLYTDEIEILNEAAQKSGKKELKKFIGWLYDYSKQKTRLNNGPVKIRFK